MNYYEKWDTLYNERWQFREYLLNHIEEIENIYGKYSKKVISTFGRGLSIASPSRFSKYMMGKNHRPGRIIKTIKPRTPYQVCYYDENNDPLYMEDYGRVPKDTDVVGRSNITYFVPYNNDIWTARFDVCSTNDLNVAPVSIDSYKIVRDEQGRLSGFYYIDGHYHAIIDAEEYDYSECSDGIINCNFSYYLEGRDGVSKDVLPGFSNSPLEEWKYIFYVNEKGKVICYDSYKNKNGEFILLQKRATK